MQQLFTVYYPSLLQHVIHFLSHLERTLFEASVLAQFDAAFTQTIVFWMTPFITHHLTRLFDVVSSLFVEKQGRLQLQADVFPRFQKLWQGDLQLLSRKEATAYPASQEAREAMCQHIARNVAKAMHLYGTKLESLCFTSASAAAPSENAKEEQDEEEVAISLSRDLLDHLWHMMARSFGGSSTEEEEEASVQRYARRIGFALDDFGAILDTSQRALQKRKRSAVKANGLSH